VFMLPVASSRPFRTDNFVIARSIGQNDQWERQERM